MISRQKFLSLLEINEQIQVSHWGFFERFDNEILNKMTVWSFGAYKCMFLILMIVPQEPAFLNHVTQQTNCFVKQQNVLTYKSKILNQTVFNFATTGPIHTMSDLK